MSFVNSSFYKDEFAMQGRQVLMTFGFLSPGKGLEYVIEALPALVATHPDLIYVIIGATHPNVQRTEGEFYRENIQRLACELGVEKHVRFENRYVDLTTLCRYLGAADIYITPYLGEQQIVSGTLSYAMGAGNAIVSTS